MAIIQGRTKVEAYFTGKYQDGTIVPHDKPDLMVPLNLDVIIGRVATEEEVTATCGPGFGSRWGYNGKKLILPGGDKVPGLLSREHGRILVSYGARPSDATIDAMPNGARVVSNGSPLLDYSDTIRMIYEHLSQNDSPTTLFQKGQEPRTFKSNGEKAEFKLDDLKEPLWLAIGFGNEEELGLIKEEGMIIAPFLKVWYTG